MTEHPHASTTLRRGQSLRMRAECGMTIVAAAGAVRVDYAPTWLGEQMMQEGISLREGEAHIVCRHGWFAVSASDGAATVCIVPRERIAVRMHALLARLGWRRRAPHAGAVLHDAA